MPTESTPQTTHFEIVGAKPEAMTEFLTALTKSALDLTAKEIKSLVQTIVSAEINKIDEFQGQNSFPASRDRGRNRKAVEHD